MKIIIEQRIALQATLPRYNFIRGELNRCGINISTSQPIPATAAGSIIILPQVVTTDTKTFEGVMDIIDRFRVGGTTKLSLERESYLSYVLNVT